MLAFRQLNEVNVAARRPAGGDELPTHPDRDVLIE